MLASILKTKWLFNSVPFANGSILNTPRGMKCQCMRLKIPCLTLTTIPVFFPTFLVKPASQVMNLKEFLFVIVNAWMSLPSSVLFTGVLGIVETQYVHRSLLTTKLECLNGHTI